MNEEEMIFCPEASVQDICQERGCTPEQSELIARDLDSLVDELGLKRAGIFVRELLIKLDGTAAAAALRRVVLGAEASVREEASKIDCSHVAILKAEKLIRRKLRLPKVA